MERQTNELNIHCSLKFQLAKLPLSLSYASAYTHWERDRESEWEAHSPTRPLVSVRMQKEKKKWKKNIAAQIKWKTIRNKSSQLAFWPIFLRSSYIIRDCLQIFRVTFCFNFLFHLRTNREEAIYNYLIAMTFCAFVRSFHLISLIFRSKFCASSHAHRSQFTLAQFGSVGFDLVWDWHRHRRMC